MASDWWGGPSPPPDLKIDERCLSYLVDYPDIVLPSERKKRFVLCRRNRAMGLEGGRVPENLLANSVALLVYS